MRSSTLRQLKSTTHSKCMVVIVLNCININKKQHERDRWAYICQNDCQHSVKKAVINLIT